MYRLLLVVSSVCSFFLTSYAGAYMEERFLCTVQDNTISVSIATGTDVCFTYMEQLSTGLDQVESDISQAQSYITDGNDVLYWKTVKDDLVQKKNDFSHLRDQFDVAMRDYEQELFVKVKGIVGYYLMPQRQHVIEKLEKADILLARLKRNGDKQNHRFVFDQVVLLQQHLMLLERIRFAHTFAELVPPLKVYINGGGFDVESDPMTIL